MTFIIMGVPGILLAMLVKSTLREPRLKQNAAVVIEHPSVKVVLTTLWQTRAFRHIVLAFCVSYFFNIGIFTWAPTFFMRSHGMESGELGTWFALVIGVGGLFGTYWGGVLTSCYAAGKEALQMRAVAVLLYPFGVIKRNGLPRLPISICVGISGDEWVVAT